MKNVQKGLLFLFIIFLFPILFVEDQAFSDEKDKLPGPQLVTDAWMFIAAYSRGPRPGLLLLQGLPGSPGSAPRSSGRRGGRDARELPSHAVALGPWHSG